MPRRIFISHKVKDRAAAEDIKNALDLRAAGNFEIFISERIEAGQEWDKAIWDNLDKADWLLLLYTDPSEEWNWCLFEAGFFAHHAKEGEGRLICLHTEDVPPPTPLQRWQSVPVTDGTMLENFLKELYSGINQTIDQTLVERPENLRRLADEIAGAFSRKVRRKTSSDWLTQYVTLCMNADQVHELDQTARVPFVVQCGVEQSESLDIFGRGTGKCTMGALQEGLQYHYRGMWLKSLGETLRAASLDKRPVPRIPVLYSPSLQKEYYVSLHRVDSFSDGSKEFCLVFVERIPEDEEQGQRLQSLGDMLKLGRVFRWKVLTKFYRELSVFKKRRSSQEEIKECLQRLNWAMDWVIGESQRLNILTGDDVVACFEDEEVKERLAHAFDEVWPGLFRAVREGRENADVDKVCAALSGMLRLNKEYMICAAARYQELLKEMP